MSESSCHQATGHQGAIAIDKTTTPTARMAYRRESVYAKPAAPMVYLIGASQPSDGNSIAATTNGVTWPDVMAWVNGRLARNGSRHHPSRVRANVKIPAE